MFSNTNLVQIPNNFFGLPIESIEIVDNKKILKEIRKPLEDNLRDFTKYFIKYFGCSEPKSELTNILRTIVMSILDGMYSDIRRIVVSDNNWTKYVNQVLENVSVLGYSKIDSFALFNKIVEPSNIVNFDFIYLWKSIPDFLEKMTKLLGKDAFSYIINDIKINGNNLDLKSILTGNFDIKDEEIQTTLNGIVRYYVEFFKNDYKDRNSINIEFDKKEFKQSTKKFIKDIKSKEYNIQNSDVSPKIAGQLVSIFIDCIGDKIFKVDFYSQDILDLIDQKSKLSKEVISMNSESNEIPSNAYNTNYYLAKILPIENEVYTSEKEIEALQVRIEHADSTEVLHLNFEKIQKESKKKLYNTILSERYTEFLKKMYELYNIDNEIENEKNNFTCYKAKFIETYLQNKWIQFYKSGKKYTLDKNKKEILFTKCKPEDRKDFAGLLGMLIAHSARQAERFTKSQVGTFIRGTNQASLDNEVIAEIISSIISMFVKKIVEKITSELLEKILTDPDLNITIDKKYDKVYAFLKLEDVFF